MSAPPRSLGEFRLVRELGRGGMGVVWLAVDRLEREVALKVLSALEPDDALRFQREVEALGALRHPGVVGVHASGRGPGGEPWVACELVPGRDLSRLVEEEGPLAPVAAVRIVRDLAAALAAVHAAGLVHRDVKPGNAILRPDGRAVLIDFGLVRGLDARSLTLSGEVLGTPAWMAPEQARGQRADPRADVWALAATLGFLLVGRPPFAGQAPIATLLQVIEGKPEWPVPLAPGLSPALEAVVRRGMALDPAARYPDGAAFLGALDAVLAGTTPPRSASPLPWLAGAATLGIGLAVLGGLGSGRREPAPAVEPAAAPPSSAAVAAPAAPDVVSWPRQLGLRESEECDLSVSFLGEWLLSAERMHDAARAPRPGRSRLDRVSSREGPWHEWHGRLFGATAPDGLTCAVLVGSGGAWSVEWWALATDLWEPGAKPLARIPLEAFTTDHPTAIALWAEGTERGRAVITVCAGDRWSRGQLRWVELPGGEVRVDELRAPGWDVAFVPDGGSAWVALGRERFESLEQQGGAELWSRDGRRVRDERLGARATRVDVDASGRALCGTSMASAHLIDDAGCHDLGVRMPHETVLRGVAIVEHEGQPFALVGTSVKRGAEGGGELRFHRLAPPFELVARVDLGRLRWEELARSVDRRCVALAGLSGHGVAVRSVEELFLSRAR